MAKEFCYNVAYTVAANESAKLQERLSHAELFQGIKRGGRYPGDFGDFVKSCEVTSGHRHQFVREIVIGDGAVHTADGTKIIQDVFIQDGLYVCISSSHCPYVAADWDVLTRSRLQRAGVELRAR